MPSLKEYRNRIESVKSTRKITSAMKMVAASKLRRAQEKAEAARPYALRMGRILETLAANVQPGASVPRLLSGTGSSQRHLLIIMTSDRGLCGGFNSALVREVRRHINGLLKEGREVSLICVGRKGRDMLRRTYAKHIIDSLEGPGKRVLSFADAQAVAEKILARFDAGQADVVTLFYNRFKSVISQIPTGLPLVPLAVPAPSATATTATKAVYEFEPSEESILADLLPRNLTVQIFTAMLESAAGEQGARMSAMDSATRNASEMIANLTLTYNRARQAYITKELIEIISGAEAV